MKTKYLAALLIGVLAMAPLAYAAKSPSERIGVTMNGLDDLIKETDVARATPALAPILKTEAAPLSKALVDQKFRFSEVVVANLVAEKAGKPLGEVLEANLGADWLKVLEGAKIGADEAIERMLEVHSDVAFAIMDLPRKKGKKK
jgi:hypothetical protein